jgi:hypothetical protein
MSVRRASLSKKLTAVLCSVLVLPASATRVRAGTQNAPADAETKIPTDQLDSLVAPIALYPDPLLAQVLAASTYPLELIELQQWVEKNKSLKDKALVDAVEKQNWDPSVQAMAPLPDVVKLLTEDIKWTTDLGNAFLAQQSDVMDAIQRMRAKAEGKGNLKSTEQQRVETKVVDNKSVIVIEQSNPQVVYVPSYNPTVVYGPPAYPYPPIYYPPPGYYAAGMAISFGVGMAIGAAWNGGWGWGCGWGSNNNITINNNNNFVNNSNRQNINSNRQNVNNRSGGTGAWQHNPTHRGGAPYSNRATADRYGGSARGGAGGAQQGNARPGQVQAGGKSQAGGGGDRLSNGNGRAKDASGNRTAGAGGDRVGNRTVPSGAGGGSRGNAFGGASSGADGRSARTSSARGQSSMGGARGGGGGGRRRR